MPDFTIRYNGSATIYGVARLRPAFTVWSTALVDFEAWNDANIGDYDVALASLGGDLYGYTLPADMPDGSSVVVNCYVRAGGAPAITDLPLGDPQFLTKGVPDAGVLAATAGYVTLAECRSLVRESVLWVEDDADTSNYSDSRVDRAIKIVGDAMEGECECTWSETGFASLQANAGTEDLTSDAGFTGLTPGSVEWVRIGTSRLRAADPRWLYRHLEADDTAGRPTHYAFGPPTGTVLLYPPPDDDYTLTVGWHPPFTTWTPGQADGSITLNVPARWLYRGLWFGGGSALVYGEQNDNNLFASKGWQMFTDYLATLPPRTGLDPAPWARKARLAAAASRGKAG